MAKPRETSDFLSRDSRFENTSRPKCLDVQRVLRVGGTWRGWLNKVSPGPISLGGRGGFVSWRRHYESGRWLEWTVRASRESASKKEETRPTRKRRNQTRDFCFLSRLGSAFQLCLVVQVCVPPVSGRLCVWEESIQEKKWFKSWRNHVECSSACLAHTLWCTHLVDYTH